MTNKLLLRFCAGHSARVLHVGPSEPCHNVHMSNRRRVVQDLHRLRFQDALDDCIALSEAAMDMVEAFSSRNELIWIQNGFKPSRRPRRENSRRRSGQS